MDEPAFQVTGDTTLVLDARQGQPVGLEARDRPEARVGAAAARFLALTPTGLAGTEYFMADFSDMYVRPSDTVAPAGQFRFELAAFLARPDGEGGFAGSPYTYNLSASDDRRVPAELVHRIGDRGLAVVERYFSVASGSTTGNVDGMLDVGLPGSLITYSTPGVSWGASFTDDPATNRQVTLGRTYSPGRHRERWNAAPFGLPDLAVAPFVSRRHDQLNVQVPLFSPQGPEQLGESLTDTAVTTLERDGEPIGETPFPGYGDFRLPPEEATYRLSTSATRSTSPLSTRVEAAWSFRSGTVDSADALPMPLLGVRFAPRLDDHNRAPAGRAFSIPVRVTRTTGADTGPLDALTVDVSYDDGATWEPARLTGQGDERTARVRHPGADGYVSLRARAIDTAGNTVEQTVIHAYALTAG